MLQKVALVLVGLLLAMLVASPVLAAAPAQGVVVEGRSVPGIALEDSRTSVAAAYGQPILCEDLPYYDGRSGQDGICYFDVDDGGKVIVHYQAVDGGPAQGRTDDVVFNIRWTQPASGWVTQAGVNTDLALHDPEAVIAAYPEATVIYNSVFGNVERIEDEELGILIDYHFEYLSGTLSVVMAITAPSEPSSTPEALARVTDINLSVEKHRGERKVQGLVRVEDQWGSGVANARVAAIWTLPDGRRQAVEATTSHTGWARLQLSDAPRGILNLHTEDVLSDNHQFDPANSVVSATIKVK
ncbi:MAG: hypothetical protein R3300_08210 [Candidatus Promineifilaceae bacterium]|nr:hypothetical protein [Candidatus Promineifilaceae bacterium]